MECFGSNRYNSLRVSKHVLAIFLYAAVLLNGVACDKIWTLPSETFKGISKEGSAQYIAALGNLGTSTSAIPLFAIFSSENRAVSTLQSPHWTIPLLDSNLVQTDANQFLVIGPDGLALTYTRDPKNPRQLTGQSAWIGSIDDDFVTFRHPCGASIVYKKGRIQQLKYNERLLNFEYQDGKVTRITEKGAVALEVKRSAQEVALAYNSNQTASFFIGSLPIVDTILEKNVVSRTAPGVSEITLNGQPLGRISYEVNDAMLPTIKISGHGARTMTWNPVTKKIVRVDDWNYFPKFPERTPNQRGVEWSLDRRNDAGQLEKCRYKSNGAVTERVLGERMERMSIFASGLLQGKVREKIIEESGKVIIRSSFTYDEKARVIRQDEKTASKNSSTIYRYDDKTGRLSETQVSIDGVVTQYTFDKNGFFNFTSQN